MAQPSDSVIEPIPISYISGRYLIFDVDVVIYLRKKHNICGVLIGSIPQIPQQNTFLGLPLELLPEEARVLVRKEVAYIVDDAKWHAENLRSMAKGGIDRKAYLDSLRAQGLEARKQAEDIAAAKARIGLAKQKKIKAKKETLAASAANAVPTNESSEVTPNSPLSSDPSASASSHQPSATAGTSTEESLFNDTTAQAAVSPPSSSKKPLMVTPTTSYSPKSLPETDSDVKIKVPLSYPLYEHLHSKEYFVTPGLRFGCDYTVYPGDPLRFHSHYLAVGYEWDQDIPLLDIIAGGRLGTGVKKGFLLGGAKKSASELSEEREGEVRTFCIEWGGM